MKLVYAFLLAITLGLAACSSGTHSGSASGHGGGSFSGGGSVTTSGR